MYFMTINALFPIFTLKIAILLPLNKVLKLILFDNFFPSLFQSSHSYMYCLSNDHHRECKLKLN